MSGSGYWTGSGLAQSRGTGAGGSGAWVAPPGSAQPAAPAAAAPERGGQERAPIPEAGARLEKCSLCACAYVYRTLRRGVHVSPMPPIRRRANRRSPSTRATAAFPPRPSRRAGHGRTIISTPGRRARCWCAVRRHAPEMRLARIQLRDAPPDSDRQLSRRDGGRASRRSLCWPAAS